MIMHVHLDEALVTNFPLQEIRVIDLTQYAPGPYATRLLSDLGADVIKIEPPGGDPLRQLFKPPGQNISPVYLRLNQGKQIARLDLKSASVLQQLEPLFKSADVLVESFRPGVMLRLGLDWPQLRLLNPDLVYCSLSGYGQDGPGKDAAGHDINYNAAAGLFSFCDHPKVLFPLVADHSGAMSAVTAILAALVSRGNRGGGAYLDISLYETILSWQYPASSSNQNSANSELQLVTGGAACYNIYSTADNRHITLGALEEKFWSNFCEAVNESEWISRQYEPFPQLDLIERVGSLFSRFSLQYWKNKLKNIDCCFEPIPLADEIYQHPQTRARNLFDHDKFSFPGKINQKNCSDVRDLEELEVHQLPNWKENLQ